MGGWGHCLFSLPAFPLWLFYNRAACVSGRAGVEKRRRDAEKRSGICLQIWSLCQMKLMDLSLSLSHTANRDSNPHTRSPPIHTHPNLTASVAYMNSHCRGMLCSAGWEEAFILPAHHVCECVSVGSELPFVVVTLVNRGHSLVRHTLTSHRCHHYRSVMLLLNPRNKTAVKWKRNVIKKTVICREVFFVKQLLQLKQSGTAGEASRIDECEVEWGRVLGDF